MKITIEGPDQLIQTLLEILRQCKIVMIPGELSNDGAQTSYEKTLATQVDQLELPEDVHITARAYNVLLNIRNRAGLSGRPPGAKTIGELCRLTEKQFLSHKNAGHKTLDLIRRALAVHGLRFGMTDEEIAAYREGKFKL